MYFNTKPDLYYIESLSPLIFKKENGSIYWAIQSYTKRNKYNREFNISTQINSNKGIKIYELIEILLKIN